MFHRFERCRPKPQGVRLGVRAITSPRREVAAFQVSQAAKKGKTQMETHSAQFLHGRQGIKDRSRPQFHWLIRIFAAIARAASAVQAELRARRDAAELASLDEHMLRDIGVRRSEIHSLVRRSIASPRRCASFALQSERCRLLRGHRCSNQSRRTGKRGVDAGI